MLPRAIAPQNLPGAFTLGSHPAPSLEGTGISGWSRHHPISPGIRPTSERSSSMKKLIVGSLVTDALVARARARSRQAFRRHGGPPWAHTGPGWWLEGRRGKGHGIGKSGGFVHHTTGEFI